MLKYQNSDSVYKYNKAANEQEWEKMQQIQEQKQQRQDIQLHHLIEKILSAQLWNWTNERRTRIKKWKKERTNKH